jgi:phosphoribosyl 1,2-cyclic phosphodiesterase
MPTKPENHRLGGGKAKGNAAPKVMSIRYYGVRGSLPTPPRPQLLERKLKFMVLKVLNAGKRGGFKLGEIFDRVPFYLRSSFGGNTPCVLVRVKGHTLIFDAGSGIRELGLDLMKEEFGQGKGKALFFFSHTHWDHIQGLPFFTPLFIPGNKFDFYSCMPDLEKRLRDQQDPRYFPVDMNVMAAKKEFLLLEKDEVKDFGDFRVRVLQQNHPGGSHAFRVDAGGRSFIYCTDVEFNDKNYEQLYQSIDFFRGADVLTFDSQYTFMESLNKVDWGHSSIQIGIDLANHANVNKVVLFHYDPTHSDSKINEIAKIGISYKNLTYPDSAVEIVPSYEGLEITL